MPTNKQKLELTWIGKNNPEYDIANIEPRILEENPKLSNCVNDPKTENMIIHGDNLLALKALLPEYEGRVKCIYIDPPYNTGNAFEHYDDSVEHSTWLSLMKPRLEILKNLLSSDGVIFIQIDENEYAYLKVLMDEIFGRNNFISTFVWQKKSSGSQHSNLVLDFHEYILNYSKNISLVNPYLVNRSEKQKESFKNSDDYIKTRGKFLLSPLKSWLDYRKTLIYPIQCPDGSFVETQWTCAKDTYQKLLEDDRILFKKGKNGTYTVYKKQYENDREGKVKPPSLLKDIVQNSQGTRESKILFGNHPFDNPKPESLISFILEMSTNEKDFVLDSFLGSGTTAAVAHKMGRKYIGIEMGEHAYTHCKVRLDKVIDGTDQGGISKAVEWKGGGAYKFYELAPSFIIKDEFGNPIIDSFYNDTKLIKAMCKLMNFTFKPSQTEYWKHGVGQGKNFIYVTTQILSVGIVEQIKSHLKDNESLVICPKKFEAGCEKVDGRIMIKKIPQSVLEACHFGKKEYLLPIKAKAIEEAEIENDLEDK